MVNSAILQGVYADCKGYSMYYDSSAASTDPVVCKLPLSIHTCMFIDTALIMAA